MTMMNKFNKKLFAIIVAFISASAIVLIVVFLPGLSNAKRVTFNELPTWEVLNPVSTVFVMDSIPHTAGSLAAGDSTVPNEYLIDPAIDTLLLMMEAKEIYFHKTVQHPSGIVGPDNVVVLKGNFQWTSRNTTSTDRIKGLILHILNHPDGFTGEIVICDNTQDIGTGIGDNDNNSEDELQSIDEVVSTFYSKGYPVYIRDWSNIWDNVAQEYRSRDYNDGFVYESSSKVSYPKFLTPSGNHYVSLRYGVWSPSTQQYNSDKLCIIDIPVLKAHSWAGATIAIKNWIGVLTTAYANSRYGGFNSMHDQYFFGPYALVAKVMAVTFPKLTIVDAAWTTCKGPVNLYEVENTKMLLASTDPVALSWYAAKFILTPIAVYPFHTNPDNEGGNYYNIIGPWTSCLQDSGFNCTKDSSKMSVYDRNVLLVNSIGQNKILPVTHFTLFQNYPNPFNNQTIIKFELKKSETVVLVIYDINGRAVKTLVGSEALDAGQYSFNWDGKSDAGKDVSSGVYFYRLSTRSEDKTMTMILEK
jgi:hypothetical protein